MSYLHNPDASPAALVHKVRNFRLYANGKRAEPTTIVKTTRERVLFMFRPSITLAYLLDRINFKRLPVITLRRSPTSLKLWNPPGNNHECVMPKPFWITVETRAWSSLKLSSLCVWMTQMLFPWLIERQPSMRWLNRTVLRNLWCLPSQIFANYAGCLLSQNWFRLLLNCCVCIWALVRESATGQSGASRLPKTTRS